VATLQRAFEGVEVAAFHGGSIVVARARKASE
jgi:hypothetical protein